MFGEKFFGGLFMYGAIFGDIKCAWHRIYNNNMYFLVDRNVKITGHTVTLFALVDALTSVDIDNDTEIKEEVTRCYLKCDKNSLNKDFFDPKFEEWLVDEKHLPIQSEDNGAVARAAIIPFLCNDFDRITELAKLTAEITCSNSYSIFNAQFAAVAVYYAIRTSSKAEIKTSLEHFIGSEIKEVVQDKNIVVEAVLDFLNSTDINSAVENSISRGGNINVRTMISGSIAEAFYGIPFVSKEMCNRELSEKFFKILDRFDSFSRRNFLQISGEVTPAYEEGIEIALRRFCKNENQKNFSLLMEEIYYSMCDGAKLRIPLVIPDRNKMYSIGQLPEGTEYLYFNTGDGRKFVAAFTNEDENFRKKFTDVYLTDIRSIFSAIVNGETEADGIILNPDNINLTFFIEKDSLKDILEYKPKENEMFLFDGHISELSARAFVTSNYEGFKDISLPNYDALVYAHFMKNFPNSDSRYIIYSPLGFYEGANKDIIFDCCQACLNLAKKYHITSVAFPFYFAFAGGLPVINAAINDWFNKNKNYGMTVIVATGTERDRDNGKDKNFFAVNFTDEENTDNKSAEENISVDKGSVKFDYSKGKATATSSGARQKARDFKNQFADLNDFYTALKNFGFAWKAENSNSEKIKTMWALNALACAIDEYGFDPFSQD